MRRDVSFALFALCAVGCVSAPVEVTTEELCAARPTYDGTMFTVTLDLSATTMHGWGSTLVACTEEDPCCNSGRFLHGIACQTGPDLVLSPESDAAEPGWEEPYLCYGDIGLDDGACERPDCTTTGVVTLDVTARLVDGVLYLDPVRP